MKTYFDKNPSEYLDQLMDAQDSDLLLKNAKKNLELMKKNFDLIIKKINDYNNENVNKNEINFKDSLSINKNKIDYIDNIKSYTHKMQFQAHISKYLEALLNKRKEWFSIFIKKYVDNCMNNLRDILKQTNTIINFIEDENTPQIKASFCLKGINEIKEIISNLKALNGYLLDYNSYCDSKISPIVVLMFYYHNFADGGFTNKINKNISYFEDELDLLEIRYNNYNISTENIPNKKEITEKIVWNGTYNQLIAFFEILVTTDYLDMNLFKNTPTTLAKHFLTKDSKNLSPQVIRNNMAKDGSYTKKRKELIQDVEAEFTKSTQYLGTTE